MGELMRKKRVLLFSEGFGTGHTGAAYALTAGIRRLNPDIQCRVIELGKFLNPTVAPWILSAYRKTVSNHPRLVGTLYKTQYNKPLGRLTRMALHRVFYNRALQLINRLKPDLIVCTHPLPAAVIARLKRGGLDVPLFTVITDYDAHASWVHPETDRYLVSADRVKSILTARGIPQEQVKVTGIPVHPKFWEPHNRSRLRKELGLADIPSILIMGGGWGLMFGRDIMDALTARLDEVQLIFCMGSNDRMIDRMKRNPKLRHPNVQILGYRSDIDKLMEVSDLLITKPGGMTCTEAMAKGIPMLFYKAIPGQEEKNCQFFVELGLGEVLDDGAVVDRWVSMLRREYGKLQRQRQHRLSPDSNRPTRSAMYVLECLGGTAVPRTAESRPAYGPQPAAEERKEAVYVAP